MPVRGQPLFQRPRPRPAGGPPGSTRPPLRPGERRPMHPTRTYGYGNGCRVVRWASVRVQLRLGCRAVLLGVQLLRVVRDSVMFPAAKKKGR